MVPHWVAQLHHQIMDLFLGYYVFSSAVGSLPPPSPASSAFYTWFYGFCHILAANATKLIQSKYPQYFKETTTTTVTSEPKDASKP